MFHIARLLIILKHATSQIRTCSADTDIQKNCVEQCVNWRASRLPGPITDLYAYDILHMLK
jgi:hypothetical protein